MLKTRLYNDVAVNLIRQVMSFASGARRTPRALTLEAGAVVTEFPDESRAGRL